VPGSVLLCLLAVCCSRCGTAPVCDCGFAVVVTTLALAPVLRLENKCPNPLLPYETLSVRRLLFHDRELRAFAGANALWEFSFSGLKSFIVLYVVRGLGRSPLARLGGDRGGRGRLHRRRAARRRLADRHGMCPVMRVSALIYGTGLVAGVFCPLRSYRF
jgi:hypothetical protein